MHFFVLNLNLILQKALLYKHLRDLSQSRLNESSRTNYKLAFVSYWKLY